MEDSIKILTKEVVKILGNNNCSIYLYGSITLNDFKVGWSDIDILCLTEESISEVQGEQLVNLRQNLLNKFPGKDYFRMFEGGFLSLSAFLGNLKDKVVYWGTSGQRITEKYVFDAFSTMELKDSGILLHGKEIRELINYPSENEQIEAVQNHYNIIRKYAQKTDSSLYSAGWLLDVARCIYTLRTGKIISKTDAGEWALYNELAPDRLVMEKAIEIRKNPNDYKNDNGTKAWLETLGPYVQKFADVLEKELGSIYRAI